MLNAHKGGCWRMFALLAAMCLTLTQVGCILRICNADPFEEPVDLEFTPEPDNNPDRQLLVGECGEWTFSTQQVNVFGEDPNNPGIEDEIDVELALGVTEIHWDGFDFVEGPPPPTRGPSRAGEDKGSAAK